MQNNLYNINIEKTVLNSVVFEPALYDDLAGSMKADDMFHPFHKALFKALGYLTDEKLPIADEFIKQRLVKSDEYNEDAFLDVLSVTPVSNLRPYIEELKELSSKRALVGMSNEIKKLCEENDLDASELINTVESKLFLIASSDSSKDFRDAFDICKSTLEYIRDMKAKGNNLLTGLDTGFYELNKKTAGFGKGDLIIIAARPAMGKTAFALNLASRTLDNGLGVAVFSLEMPAEQMLLRMLAAKTNIPLQHLRVGNLNDDEWTRLTNAYDYFSKSRLFVDDEGNLNISKLRSKLRKVKAKHPEISLAIIDYLQLMSGNSQKDRHIEVSEISRGLKLLARELDMPIIALSQLNRSLENRDDKRPTLSDIRESGSIEQDADQILFVYRGDVYRAKDEKNKEEKAKKEGKEYRSDFVDKPVEDAEIIIGKNRNGPTGTVYLAFHKNYTRFESVEKGYSEHFVGETKMAINEKVDIPHISF